MPVVLTLFPSLQYFPQLIKKAGKDLKVQITLLINQLTYRPTVLNLSPFESEAQVLSPLKLSYGSTLKTIKGQQLF